jgi:beta-N-acetylhexosaminidase
MTRRTKIILVIIIAVCLSVVGGFFVAKYLSHIQYPGQPNNASQPTKQPQKTALSCVESLPDATLIGQKLMVAGYSNQLTNIQPILVQNGIGGIIIMDETPAQTIQAFRSGFSIAPLVAVDQEGGTVQRYKSEGVILGAADMASVYTPDQAYDKYYADAQYLKSIGITVNFAPVVDVVSTTPSPLPGRMYSDNASVVTQYAAQFIKAFQKVGITPVVKHFPGLGSTTTNTDDGSATTNPLAVLQDKDIVPYKSLANFKPDAMISNAIVPDLTNGEPAVWSSAAVSLLRGEGYQDAVIYSDSLTAKAIPGTLQNATIKAWQAGVDIALIVQKPNEQSILPDLFDTIISQTTTDLHNGSLDKAKFSESVVRILQRKNIDPCTLS